MTKKRTDNLAPPRLALDETERLSLCEALDRVLNKGAVVAGEVIISVADIELIYLGLQVVLKSVDGEDLFSNAEHSRCEAIYDV